MTVDWTKPIELHDGTPVWLAHRGYHGGPNPDDDGHYWIEGEDGYRECLGSSEFAASKVRNRIEPVSATAELARIKLPEQPTLRDQFAMAFLTGQAFNVTIWLPEKMAEQAYMYADAMLVERAK